MAQGKIRPFHEDRVHRAQELLHLRFRVCDVVFHFIERTKELNCNDPPVGTDARLEKELWLHPRKELLSALPILLLAAIVARLIRPK